LLKFAAKGWLQTIVADEAIGRMYDVIVDAAEEEFME
jgi:hypothetical protein